MGRFSEQVPVTNQPFGYLPLFHTCDAYDARAHMSAGAIVTDDVCEVFEEKITYLFYGRAAFKYNPSISESTTNPAVYPVAFIFDITKIPQIKRIFPLDSGAVHHNLYKKFLHGKTTVLDFEMEGTDRKIADIVLHFHGDNSNYRKFKISREIDPFDFESLSYAKMHNSFSADLPDERRATIEVQAPERLSFDKNALEALIIPTQLADSSFLNTFISKFNIDRQIYEVETWDPKQSFGLVAAAAKAYIDRRGEK